MRGVGESCDTWRHESPLEGFVFMRPRSLPPFSDLSTPHCPWPLAPECGSPEWGEGKARRGLQREEALGGGGGGRQRWPDLESRSAPEGSESSSVLHMVKELSHAR